MGFCMKRLLLGLVFCCVAGSAAAYHTDDANESTKADSNASCNAAFHLGCQTDQTFTASSSGFAAPAGALGSSPAESAAISMLLAAAIGGGIVRSAAARGRIRRVLTQMRRYSRGRVAGASGLSSK